MSRMMKRLEKNIGESLVMPVLAAAYVAAKDGAYSTIQDFASAVKDIMRCPPVDGEPNADLYKEACDYLGGKN